MYYLLREVSVIKSVEINGIVKKHLWGWIEGGEGRGEAIRVTIPVSLDYVYLYVYYLLLACIIFCVKRV